MAGHYLILSGNFLHKGLCVKMIPSSYLGKVIARTCLIIEQMWFSTGVVGVGGELRGESNNSHLARCYNEHGVPK